jgi:GT2 family glycosyltransferase
MAPRAAIAIPTRNRPRYLDVALASICAQAAALDAEVVVVDDGPDAATRAVAVRHCARYVPHEAPRGINVARNTAVAVTDAPLLAFVDDDVEVWDGWLAALLRAADEQPPEAGVFTGPIRPRIEDHRYRSCGREGPPITFLDLGPDDVDAVRAWGANMAIRREALERVGPFAEHLVNGGDEEEWQARWQALGGRVRYVAAAGLDHRRAGDDARLRALMRSAYRRGRNMRAYDRVRGADPRLAKELRVLAGCGWHTLRRACPQGVVMGANSAGRVMETLRPR